MSPAAAALSQLCRSLCKYRAEPRSFRSTPTSLLIEPQVSTSAVLIHSVLCVLRKTKEGPGTTHGGVE